MTFLLTPSLGDVEEPLHFFSQDIVSPLLEQDEFKNSFPALSRIGS